MSQWHGEFVANSTSTSRTRNCKKLFINWRH